MLSATKSRSSKRLQQRGACAFGIGVEHSKTEVNIGTLLRSAVNFGASFVFTVGRRYAPQKSDTLQSWHHIPVWHFNTWEEYHNHAPYDWRPLGIEIAPEATDLPAFVHPNRAVYILGAEDRGLSVYARQLCQALITIPSTFCLNVAVAGAIVMYDRTTKLVKQVKG